jgi:hypothetical protein
METLHSWWKSYTRAGFIGMGIPGTQAAETDAREKAAAVGAEYGWEFEEIPGDISLFRGLLAGDWSPDEFVVARPGEQIVPVYDDRVVTATSDHQPIPPRAAHKRDPYLPKM